jgi:hypothetical protein
VRLVPCAIVLGLKRFRSTDAPHISQKTRDMGQPLFLIRLFLNFCFLLTQCFGEPDQSFPNGGFIVAGEAEK